LEIYPNRKNILLIISIKEEISKPSKIRHLHK
jgi:hypothetical protein